MLHTQAGIISLFFILNFSSSKYTSQLNVVRENNIHFGTNSRVINDYDLQYYIEIRDKNMQPIEGYNRQTKDFEYYFKPLDVYDYWGKKGEEDYYIILNKAIYLMEEKVDYFTESLLTNEGFIQQTLPKYNITRVDDKEYHIECGTFAPDFDYSLAYFQAPYTDRQILPVIEYIKKLNPELGVPKTLTLQHNYNFGKVLFQKTSKMSIAVFAYYPYGENRTLVLNYTLNYVHNLPPKIMGGYKIMMQEIVEGMRDLVLQTRRVCRQRS